MKNILKIVCLLLGLSLALCMFVACGDSDDVEGQPMASDSSDNSVSGVTSVTEGNTSGTGSLDNTVSNNGSGSPQQPSSSGNVGGSTDTESAGNGSTSSAPVVDTYPSITLSAEKQGDSITVTADIKNNPGLTGFDLKLNYDKNTVTPVSFRTASGFDITSNLQQGTVADGGISAIYASASGFKTDGTLFTVSFDIKDKTAEKTEFFIKSAENSFVDLNVKYVDFKVGNVEIKLK